MSSSSAAENRKLGRLREGEEEELEGEDVLRRSLKNEFFVNCYKLLEVGSRVVKNQNILFLQPSQPSRA